MTETKREVVEAILLAKDIDTIWDSSNVRYYLNRYDNALPDDLPVIPEAVSEYIQWGKSYDIQLYMMYVSQLIHRPGFKKLTDDAKSWIISSSNIFARAWVLAIWRVEETGEIVELEEEK